MEIYGSISEAGEFGQNVFLDKCIQILYKYEYNSPFQLYKRLPKIELYKYSKNTFCVVKYIF